jgi:tetratricopeptide (TPR) repeat protein
MDAGGLVGKWLRELYELQGNTGTSFDEWTKTNFPSLDPKAPSLSYAAAFARRHPSPVERQREIEMICSHGEPAYGYATLAQLVSHKNYGRFCNTILTTNFDDLIADALYLYGERNARPLVVTHEALARYVRTNSPRPTVVKLHGDAHLDPKNLQPETREIDVNLAKQLYPFLQDHALIFVGYGGNDESILKFVQECPVPALAPPIYWVSRSEPPEAFAAWLLQRNGLRVDHTDFDQLMHLIRSALSIELLDRGRWTQIGDTYYGAFEQLRQEIESISAHTEDTQALRDATSETAKSLPDDWTYYGDARDLVDTDKAAAEKKFREGLDRFPDSAVLNGNFALLLEELEQYDEAEDRYKKSLQADPKRPLALTNYALFLKIRGKYDEAEALFKRAIEADPKHSYSLQRYASFRNEVRSDIDGAEALYKRSVECADGDVRPLVVYASFLAQVRKNLDSAEVLFREAFDREPRDGYVLRSLGYFYESSRGNLDKAEEYYKAGVEADPNEASSFSFYGDFVERYRKDPKGAEALYQQALKINPNDAFALEGYARVLESTGENPSLTAEYKERADRIRKGLPKIQVEPKR